MAEPDATRVAELFAEVFEVAAAGADDDFFSLGGDSLLATALVARIEQEFGAVLPISALLEAPTPKAIAAAIMRTTAEQIGSPLVTVNGTGSGPALCCVHGMNGEAVFPRRVADWLGTSRPIYGFRAIGLLPGERPLDSVEHIAQNYLAALRRVRPKGPYVLLGHCGGSMISYEMAQQLTAGGDDVAGLILIDPAHQRLTAPFLFSSGETLAQTQAAFGRHVAELLATFDAGADLSDGRRRALLKVVLHSAVAAYAPAPFNGPTLLLHSTARRAALLNQARGFPALLSDYEPVEIKSDHMNLFEKHMPEIVKAIGAFLDRLIPVSGAANDGPGHAVTRQTRAS